MKKLIPVLAVTSLIIVYSCSKGGYSNNSNNGGGGGGTSLDCSTVSKSFSTDVLPIIQNKCALSGCHIAGSSNGPGELTNYQEVFNARALIRPAIANGIMPKSGTITTAEKNSILCWIDSGAPNN